MLDTSVYDIQNQEVGKVKDPIVDKDGQVAVVVVDMGSSLGMGGKSVAVKLDDIKTDSNPLTLAMTEQLQQAEAHRPERQPHQSEAAISAGARAPPARAIECSPSETGRSFSPGLGVDPDADAV